MNNNSLNIQNVEKLRKFPKKHPHSLLLNYNSYHFAETSSFLATTFAHHFLIKISKLFFWNAHLLRRRHFPASIAVFSKGSTGRMSFIIYWLWLTIAVLPADSAVAWLTVDAAVIGRTLLDFKNIPFVAVWRCLHLKCLHWKCFRWRCLRWRTSTSCPRGEVQLTVLTDDGF